MYAYLIMAHNQFGLLNKLLRALDYPENDIFIHIDKKAGVISEQVITNGVNKSNVYFVSRNSVVWGHYSQIECELQLFEAALKQGSYDYLHLISGVDFPLKSQRAIHEFFDKNKGKEFVHFEGKVAGEDMEKIQCLFPLQKYIGNRKKDTSFLYCIQRAFVWIQRGLKADRHKKDTTVFYKGANWVSITGEFARYLADKKDQIRKCYKMSLCCDEIFLQTELMNSPFKDNLYDKSLNNDYKMCMRMIDWKRGGPYIFRTEDFDELVSGGMMFARKFSTDVDSEVVDRLLKYDLEGEKED